MILNFTDAAREMVLAHMREGYVESPALRVAVVPGCSPFAPEYEISLVEEWEQAEGDAVLDLGGFKVLVDPASAESLDGAEVDFVERGGEAGYDVRNPNVKQLGAERPTGPLAERVHEVIEGQINPGVAAHGGRITLVEVQDHVAYITMSGGCQGCGMAKVTLSQGVARMIRQAVPEIVDVRDVTDHMSGANPYYQASK